MLIKEVGHLLSMIPVYTIACFGDKAFPDIERIPDEDIMGFPLLSDPKNGEWLQCNVTINTKDYDVDQCMKDITLFEEFYYDESRHSIEATEKIVLRFKFI